MFARKTAESPRKIEEKSSLLDRVRALL